MGWQLHGSHGHSHGGGGSNAGHGHTENINVRAAFVHVLGDVLQSIGVFFAAIIIYFRPTWQLADPICTFIFSIIVLWTTITILKDAILVSAKATCHTHTSFFFITFSFIFFSVHTLFHIQHFSLSVRSLSRCLLFDHTTKCYAIAHGGCEFRFLLQSYLIQCNN